METQSNRVMFHAWIYKYKLELINILFSDKEENLNFRQN